MGCIAPPEITDMELLAHLDGVGAPATEEHLAACSYCQQRAASLDTESRLAAAALQRAACPLPHELGEYQLALVERSRAREIERHVAGCARCRAELLTLSQYLAALEPDIALSPVERARDAMGAAVRVLVAQLRPLPPLAPAFAMRGTTGGPTVYFAEEVQVTVETLEAAGAGWTLLGMVLGPAETPAMLAHLWQEDRPLADAPVDSLGNFAFDGLVSGLYDIVLTAPTLQIHIPAVHLRHARGDPP